MTSPTRGFGDPAQTNYPLQRRLFFANHGARRALCGEVGANRYYKIALLILQTTQVPGTSFARASHGKDNPAS